MRALKVMQVPAKPGETTTHHQLLPIELPDKIGAHLRALQEHVGGYITTCFRVGQRGHGIIGYCDDEGLLKRREDYSCVLDRTLRGEHYPIVGPIVIVGETPEGDSRALTDEEVAAFHFSTTERAVIGNELAVPILTYQPKRRD